MRPRLALAALLLALLVALPAASATNARFVGAGGTGSFTKAFVAVATDDLTVGTTYDVAPPEDKERYWIVKACYLSDNPTMPDVCVREDVAPLLP